MNPPRDEQLTRDAALSLAQSLGLRASEFEHIEYHLQRLPTRTEVGVFAGMWSEHCSYKSSRQWLASLPKRSPHVLAGPGAHAGVVDVGEGWAVAFKIESHNHPSAVEPYQGAATGVGGILRDIIAQGARPCLVMDSLCFGSPDSPKNRQLRDGVVAGIAGYGNAIGIANVGGRTIYDKRYEGNPLVNALAAGMVRHDGMRTAAARGVGNAVLYVGAATGRDGVLGAAFASEELDDDNVESRPHVQVGDPFAGKKLLEACLSFDESMGLVACQDMGACGITCATTEMAAAGEVGLDVDLDAIPLREAQMTPQEILLSESQERFLFVVKKGTEEQALAHFRKFGVHAAVCGRVTDGKNVVVRFNGEVYVDLPATLVAGGAPLANWPVAPQSKAPVEYAEFAAATDLSDVLVSLLKHPNIGSHAALYNHYDQSVGNRTVRGPEAASAAVLKLPESTRGFALVITGRGDVCAADAMMGAQAAVADAYRSLACAGAHMMAITDGLNMASPRDPLENRKLHDVIMGLGEALRALDIPVTGGNVSLYNESPAGPIPPTPMVGGIGIVEDIHNVPKSGIAPGHALFLVGDLSDVPTQSVYGRMRTGAVGPAAKVDLAAEKRVGEFIVAQSQLGRIKAAKEMGQGGIAVALAKLCIRGNCGVRASLPAHVQIQRADWALYGEYPALLWATVEKQHVHAFAAAAKNLGVTVHHAGETGGDVLAIGDVLTIAVSDLHAAYTAPSAAVE